MYGRTRLFWQKFLQEELAKERDRHPGLKDYERAEGQRNYRLRDERAYLFVDGVSLRVRRHSGRQRVQMLVACGVKRECPSS